MKAFPTKSKFSFPLIVGISDAYRASVHSQSERKTVTLSFIPSVTSQFPLCPFFFFFFYLLCSLLMCSFMSDATFRFGLPLF